MNYVFKLWSEVSFFVIAAIVGIATEYLAHNDVTDWQQLWPLLLAAGARAIAGAILTAFTSKRVDTRI